jgi:hypothetical protein
VGKYTPHFAFSCPAAAPANLLDCVTAAGLDPVDSITGASRTVTPMRAPSAGTSAGCITPGSVRDSPSPVSRNFARGLSRADTNPLVSHDNQTSHTNRAVPLAATTLALSPGSSWPSSTPSCATPWPATTTLGPPCCASA